MKEIINVILILVNPNKHIICTIGLGINFYSIYPVSDIGMKCGLAEWRTMKNQGKRKTKSALTLCQQEINSGHKITDTSLLDIVKIIDTESRHTQKEVERIHNRVKSASLNRTDGFDLPLLSRLRGDGPHHRESLGARLSVPLSTSKAAVSR